MDDLRWMRRAVELSREGCQGGAGGPFGAVVVRAGQLLGEGSNRVLSTNDPTAHAEVVAIREAARQAGQPHLDGATLYTSCEPCPMCLAAAYWARVERIVYANTRDDAEAIGFSDRLIYDEIALQPGSRRIPMQQMAREEALEVFQWYRDNAGQLY